MGAKLADDAVAINSHLSSFLYLSTENGKFGITGIIAGIEAIGTESVERP